MIFVHRALRKCRLSVNVKPFGKVEKCYDCNTEIVWTNPATNYAYNYNRNHLNLKQKNRMILCQYPIFWITRLLENLRYSPREPQKIQQFSNTDIQTQQNTGYPDPQRR